MVSSLPRSSSFLTFPLLLFLPSHLFIYLVLFLLSSFHLICSSILFCFSSPLLSSHLFIHPVQFLLSSFHPSMSSIHPSCSVSPPSILPSHLFIHPVPFLVLSSSHHPTLTHSPPLPLSWRGWFAFALIIGGINNLNLNARKKGSRMLMICGIVVSGTK